MLFIMLMRDYLPPANVFQGLPGAIHYLIMYSISLLGVKVQGRNPHVTAQTKQGGSCTKQHEGQRGAWRRGIRYAGSDGS